YEMGAGTGLFAKQFLDALEHKYPDEYKRSQYVLIEKSNFHRGEQENILLEHAAHVRWLDSLSDVPSISSGEVMSREESKHTGIFFSNELVDAFPVHLVEKKDGQLFEVGVTWDEAAEKLKETLYPLQGEEVINYLNHLGISIEEGQRLEIPVDAVSWVEQVDHFLDEGVWLTIDYGYTNDELRLPQYREGSLRCYDNH